ncbi:MAG: AAA family ATPase, partial [Candidatus Adiutrix sp.]|nr:AAA family ATPase [Candidatus Adiutrix sp.]
MAGLFDSKIKPEAPLAEALRPASLEEVVGQSHLLGPGKPLRLAFESGEIQSMILWGPPGVGKTTLARLTAQVSGREFISLSAVFSGVKDIRAGVELAERNLAWGKRTILFIDEIHRFNKAQHDALLPYVEDGTVILIGATTENPYFEVNKALVSRSVIFQLEHLSAEDVETLLRRTLDDKENGLGGMNIRADDDAVKFLADVSNGDARAALNAVELAALTTELNEAGQIHVDMGVAQQCIQKR